MSKILLLIFVFVLFTNISGISFEKWRIETDKNGRVVIFYEDMPVNVNESPFTSYLSVKLDNDIYNLGDDISATSVSIGDKSITTVYRINPEIIIEFETSFSDNPLVYDDIGIKFTIRVISNFSTPKNVYLRYIFNPFSNEVNKVGFSYSEETINKPIYEEDEKNNPSNIIFYPFFINFKTIPTSTFLANWRRLKDDFEPSLKKLLSFRDIKRGKWDPAVGIFYNLGTIKESTNKIEFFLGKWQKPNRFYPRVKILYSKSLKIEDNKAKLPFVVENNGDFDIDYLKLTLTSENLLSDFIYSISDFKKGQKKESEMEIILKKMSKTLKGTILARMMIGQDFYEQEFFIETNLITDEKKLKIDLKEAENKLNNINRIIENINLLLYFVNLSIETKNYLSSEKIIKACNEFRANIKKDK
ncbi:MAG TPA: hypothetical protein PKW55_02315 [Spirochaetota bacterium]|nr:hypothetical protein [Spirochaetota bacterium]HOM38318.1 hypothetical protein [Spirochaetota bacterium]HPQ48464.1 hypothetical protein [Spirochaetota bacterium]